MEAYRNIAFLVCLRFTQIKYASVADGQCVKRSLSGLALIEAVEVQRR